ncbi:MAG: rRNA maturation RNase YbeY [Gemmatimonadaceae bacterium]
MSALAVAVQREGVRSPVSETRLAAAARSTLRAEQVRHALVSVTLVTAPRIAALNRKHLRHRGATDVISFGFARERGGPVVADIYIAPAVAARNARRHGVRVREELVRLVVHGVLHALGYDHPEGDARLQSPMWRRQETLVRRAMRRTP